jgi:hypothetical protein
MKISFCLFFLVIVGLSGCASRIGNDAIGATVGGASAYALSGGEALPTAAGAIAGIGVSEIVQMGGKKNDAAIARENYDRGKSDAVKQQYWLIQDNQRKSESQPRYSLYEIPIPTTNSTVNLVPHTRVLRVEE